MGEDFVTDYLQSGLITIFANLAPLLIIWIFKIPARLSENSEATKNLTKATTELNSTISGLATSLERLERRVDVTDRLLSDIVGHPIDSGVIAEDRTKYPPVKRRRASDVD
jgi:hypothetical protein